MAPRILVAEDNPISQRVARDLLQHAGYNVEVVANGREVLAAVARCDYDLLLLDWQMPVMDGFEAVRQLRAAPATADLKVLAMTANAMAGDRARCLDAGMDDHLTKPLVPAAMLERVAFWLNGSRAACRAALEQGTASDGLVADQALDELLLLGEDEGPALLADLQLLLVEGLNTASAELDSALARQDWSALERIGHSLKSSTATLGLTSLTETYHALERAAQSAHAPTCEACVAQIHALVPVSLAALDAAIATRLAR